MFLEQYAEVPVQVTGFGSNEWVQGKIEAMGPLLDHFVGVCILANTIGMACEHFGMVVSGRRWNMPGL